MFLYQPNEPRYSIKPNDSIDDRQLRILLKSKWKNLGYLYEYTMANIIDFELNITSGFATTHVVVSVRHPITY